MKKAFPLPSGRAALVPSVLAADFSCLKDSLAPVRGLADWLQVDVMDGHFVPNLSFGPDIAAAVAAASGLPVDAHLMVAEPGRFIDAFAAAGAGLITVHAEARGAGACVARIKKMGLKAGLALRPKTPLKKIIPFLGVLDLVLIMTVEPGFGGQAFMPGLLPKIGAARALITRSGRAVWLQVDGGVNAATAELAARAGADSLVIGSALFKARSPAAFLRALRKKV
ncbi:MAG: ribulose-phosphate 3-epimerase [Elusimicrobia bacterium GWC2_61_19]|nr:MAG: ribulose-phosphate 3-epimerase [Elusimicrobia bacterium GWC2_61_19]